MSMRLSVQLMEARDLKHSDRAWRAYAQLKLGNTKHKSSVSPSGAKDPYWFEDFSFNVDDMGAVLNIIIWGQDRLSNVFLGRIHISIADILHAEKQSSSWYPLEKRYSKSKTPITGEVRLSLSLSSGELSSSSRISSARHVSDTSDPSSATSTPEHLHFRSVLGLSSSASDQGDEKSKGSSGSSSTSFLYGFVAWLSSIFLWLLPEVFVAWLSSKVSWISPLAKEDRKDAVDTMEEAREDSFIEDESFIFPAFFEDDGVCVSSSSEEMPTPLKGNLLSGTYMMSAKAMNGILFGPGSQFLKDLHALQKNTDLIEGPWTRGENDLPRRVVTYLKAATKLVPTVKATEEQVYLRADDKGFVVDVSASTPDVPYGRTFKVNVQYCIFSGSQTAAGDNTCFLRISWGVQFLSSTMMKSIIEKGARQGLQENYKQYEQLLEKYAKPQGGSLTNMESEPRIPELQGTGGDAVAPTLKGGWLEYLRVCMALSLISIILAHIYSSESDTIIRFEVWKIDLPDSCCELILAALLGAQIPLIWGLAKTLLGARQ